jgi:hypothetical protein
MTLLLLYLVCIQLVRLTSPVYTTTLHIGYGNEVHLTNRRLPVYVEHLMVLYDRLMSSACGPAYLMGRSVTADGSCRVRPSPQLPAPDLHRSVCGLQRHLHRCRRAGCGEYVHTA